ncbi:methyltransferase domain-containing protein [Candidatus Pelagibacter sp.]|nr:methyltransferase domain-containing protein [Candidatus Pelagibacter sp.]
MKKKIYLKNALWTFSKNVPKEFDKHIKKSIPLYELSHHLTLNLSDFFLNNNSNAIDIGSSTGSFLKKLSKYNKKKIQLTGIDIEKNMVSFAKKNNSTEKIKYIYGDYLKCKFPFKSKMITSFYTLAFIDAGNRQKIFNKIYKDLSWGGAFIFFEKVRAPDAKFQDITTTLYNDFKLNNGLNYKEIIEKTRSLKGVMDPFSSSENFKMLKRAGFNDYMTILKYLNFQGFFAIK